MSPDERAIRDVISTWLSASAAGDNEKVLTLMSDDVVFLVAGRSFGKEEFSAGQNALATHRIEASADVREVVVAGDRFYVARQRETLDDLLRGEVAEPTTWFKA